ncbi:hypothetical protein ABZY44_00630 [Streptomyces sp. NPDC006544]|uniref:hypothetical protein n=1 Tax=Streptomyces sp. NPDC006544 TaxID=3154583 RepID=UPI0033BA9FF7
MAGDLLLTLGRAEPRPEPRTARRAAAYATRALSATVTPILAVVDAAHVEVAPSLRDVRVLTPATVGRFLTGSAGVLKAPDVEALYASARDRGTWT